MISTDSKTKHSDDKVLNSLIIASAYISARNISGGALVTHEGPLLNPAIAFGYCTFSGNFKNPQYLVMPFFGSVMALAFYELIFVKTLDFLNVDDSESDEPLKS